MSINQNNLKLIDKAVSFLERDSLSGLSVAELGNQKILAVGPNGKEYKKCVAKEWFKSKGAKHVSFDLNALDGAVKLDLCKSLPKKFVSQFDMVTNYGTTEHVENQKEAFRNIDKMLKSTGVMVHSIPLDGYWIGHCPYHYKENFPEAFCSMNSYHLCLKQIVNRRNSKLLEFIALKMFDNFVGIPQNEIVFSERYKRNTDNLF